jgi:hypothetical protein
MKMAIGSSVPEVGVTSLTVRKRVPARVMRFSLLLRHEWRDNRILVPLNRLMMNIQYALFF